AAHHQPEPVGLEYRDHAEHHHADDQHDEEEARAAPGVQEARAAYRWDVERPAGLESVDRLVLGPVVLKNPPHVRKERNRRQVAEDEADTDQALDHDEEKASAPVHGESRKEERQPEEQ